ncbi:MAG: L,D-transpeptidase family protein [Betaproteobacteria bacterium]|nr:L,D-transpeptidase family protein [Betaproteobacteria bacterium]
MKARIPVRRLSALCALLAAPLLAWGQGGWFDGARPAPLAHQAVALLADAASHGLAPADYGVEALQAALATATQGPPPSAAQSARLAVALDAALQRYLQHLNAGRVDPHQVHHRFPMPEPSRFDAAGALSDALASGRLDGAVAAAVPRLPVYEGLRRVLVRYRGLAGDTAWEQALPPLPPAVKRGAPMALEPGQTWRGLDALARRLRLLGDLPPMAADAALPLPSAASSPPGASPVYEGALVDAVKTFQRRHGLVDDGVVGRATWQALQVSPAQRVRQIELTLERLRWTPLLQGPRMIVINVPEFVLRAYEVQDGQVRVQQAMKVIVGRAHASRTPLFSEPMRRIEFSPYWNVPPSIARKELVPQLRRSPAVFASLGYEFVTAGGQVVTSLRPELLDAVLAGNARIRQRPGPKNALGDIKFVFPNNDAIYLHHTPSVSLFERDRRDFSHGCIRVEDPVALARFVLARQSNWPEARIRAAMAAGSLSTLALDEPLPVLIAYGTAIVVQGQVRFFDDVYGYDAVLDRALRQRRLPPLPSPTLP